MGGFSLAAEAGLLAEFVLPMLLATALLVLALDVGATSSRPCLPASFLADVNFCFIDFSILWDSIDPTADGA